MRQVAYLIVLILSLVAPAIAQQPANDPTDIEKQRRELQAEFNRLRPIWHEPPYPSVEQLRKQVEQLERDLERAKQRELGLDQTEK
jgi:hypothetical protein